MAFASKTLGSKCHYRVKVFRLMLHSPRLLAFVCDNPDHDHGETRRGIYASSPTVAPEVLYGSMVKETPSKFDDFDGYYSVRFSGIEFARFAPSPVWTEYANVMRYVPDFSYTYVSTKEDRNGK